MKKDIYLKLRTAFVAGILGTALLVTGVTSANASSTIPNTIPIPDSEVVLNFGGSGLDWVYAGPIGPNEWGAGWIEPASYRAAEGWHYASLSEWALRPSWTDFIKPGHAAFVDVFPSFMNDHSKYKFTSEYWSTFGHVDIGDAAAGYLVGGPVFSDYGYHGSVPETWYVRNSVHASVPDAGSSFGLLSGALAMMGLFGRRIRS